MERRIPELPQQSALQRSSIAARTTSVGKGLPMPQEWEMMRLRCKAAVSSRGMYLSENLPKPVVKPYTTAFSSSFFST